MKRILLFLLLLLAAVSCGKEEVPEMNRSVLIYIAGRNSLSGMVSDCLDQLEKGYLPETGSKEEAVLVYLRDYRSNPQLMRISRNTDGSVCREILFNYPSDQNSAKAETLSQVLRDAENLCPAKNRGLILWSHSSGWLPKGYLNNSAEYEAGEKTSDRAQRNPVTSFGEDDIDKEKTEMELVDLAAALPWKYDYIIFDSCLMGCVEVAFELKDKCDWIAFSPAEIKSQGFPYYMMMQPLFKDDIQSALTGICTEYYEYYRQDYEKYPGTSGGTVSIVRTAGMDRLAAEFAVIAQNHRDEIYNLQDVQGYFRYDCHWFYDIDDIAQQVAGPDELKNFRSALDEAVVYKAATKGFMVERGGFYIKHYSGLSCFIPRYGQEERLKAHYRTLKWNMATALVE